MTEPNGLAFDLRREPRDGWLCLGDAWVLAVEFMQPVRARSILAYGQNSAPGSKHGTDRIGLFAEHRLRTVWFTEEEIRANLEREYHP